MGQVLWDDALSFHPDLDGEEYTRKTLDAQLHTGDRETSSEWAGLWATYLRLAEFYNAVGFAHMIVLANEAAIESPELIEHEFWIVDEYQDFNPAEDRLVRTLTERAAGVLLAGDDEQALYQELKAATPDIIIGHYEDPNFAKGMLPFCSRCSYYVCRAASAFIAKHRVRGAIAKVFLPLRVDERSPKVSVLATAGPTGAIDYIRMFLEQHADAYAQYLEEREAGTDTDPFLLVLSQSGGLTLAKKDPAEAELAELMSPYAGLTFGRSADHRRVTTYAIAGWHIDDNFAVRKLLHEEKVSNASELVREAVETGARLGDVVAARCPEVIDRVERIAALVLEAPGQEEPTAHRIHELLRLSDPAAFAHELSENPILPTTARDEEDENAVESAGAIDPVALMSAFGSKGLSAHHVVVLGCDDVNAGKMTPLAFFVALTRARESLHLVVSAKAGGAKSPHPFLHDLPGECCNYFVFKKGGRVIEELGSIQALADRMRVWSSAAQWEGVARACSALLGPRPHAPESLRKLTREGVLAGERLERGRNLPPPRHAELLAQHIAMRLRRSGRDAETLSDLVVRASARDQHNDLELALGEVWLCVVATCHGSARYGRAGDGAIGRRGYSGWRRALRRRSSPRGRARWPR